MASFRASILLLMLVLGPLSAMADKITPSHRVTSHVNVREEASPDSVTVGRLRVGEQADLLVSVPRRYKIRLPDGTVGFVSKGWTKLIPDAPDVPQFQVYFLDVGTGDSAIIDIGESEIVIDGGDSVRVLHDFAARTGIIDGPIELVVVTHGDSDHWKGLTRLLGFDGRASMPRTVLEVWEPGYNRDCKRLDSYDAFISNVGALQGIRFNRPLEAANPPAAVTGRVEPLVLPTLPQVTFSVLHTDSTPEAANNDCAYLINNASIVLMIEIAGFRFVFTGDANGKERNEPSPGTPGHIEAKLLELERLHPGTLKADVLKVPHHGSETASTQTFIDAVDPSFVIISASTKHHLPKATVVSRYGDGHRVILRTDVNRESDKDHIVCFREPEGELECNYLDVVSQP